MQLNIVLHIGGIYYSKLTTPSSLHSTVANSTLEYLRRDKLILDNYLIPCTI